MNLEEFRKALSSDATEENAQLKRQLSDLQTEYHEKLSKLENENDSLKERRSKKMANGYRNALVQQIKDAGQELINRAESMVHPENDLITDFSIVIHFEQHEVPTIDYTTSVVNKVACDRVIYQKGESNVSKI